MVTVPKVTGPRVRQRGIASARATAAGGEAAFGGGAAAAQTSEAASGLINEATTLFVKQKNKANKIRMGQARQALNKWENDNLYNAETGAINRKGQDSFGLPEELNDNFSKFTQEFGEGLANDEQRAMFSEMSEARRLSVDRWVQGHVSRETRAVEKKEFRTGLESSKERGSADPAHVATELTYITNTINDFADDNGWGKEERKQELQKHTTDLHQRVLNNMLAAGQDITAKEYFKRVRKDLDPDVSVKIQGALQEGSTRGESRKQASAILEKNDTLEDALQATESIKNTEVFDMTRNRIREEFRIRKEADTQLSDKNFQEVGVIIEETRRRDMVPPDKWDSLTVAQRKSIDSRIAQLNKGIDPETDWEKFYELKTMASNPGTRDKFLRTDLNVLRPKMSDTEFKDLVNLQSTMRKPGPESNKIANGLSTDLQIADQGFASIGLDKSKQKKEYSLYRRRIDEAVLAKKKETGKADIGTQEVQAIVDNLTSEVVTDSGFLWDTTKNLFEVEIQDFDVEDIPEGEVVKIKDSLQRHSQNPTDERIKTLWLRKSRLRSGQ